DAAQARGRLLHEADASGEASEVGRHRHDLQPGGAGNLLRRGLQLRLGTSTDGDAYALFTELACDRHPDAFTGARHKRGPSLESELHRRLLAARITVSGRPRRAPRPRPPFPAPPSTWRPSTIARPHARP